MPIYAYRCEACGFAQDVLQKMSDDTLTVCTSCAQPTFKKQVTAAGFQLKGSGWYVTDFRNGNNAAPGKTATNEVAAQSKDGASVTDGSSASADAAPSKPAAAASATAPTTSTAAAAASSAPAAASAKSGAA